MFVSCLLDRFRPYVWFLNRHSSKVMTCTYNILPPSYTIPHFCPLWPSISWPTHRLDLKFFSLFVLCIIEGFCEQRLLFVCIPSCDIYLVIAIFLPARFRYILLFFLWTTEPHDLYIIIMSVSYLVDRFRSYVWFLNRCGSKVTPLKASLPIPHAITVIFGVYLVIHQVPWPLPSPHSCLVSSRWI